MFYGEHLHALEQDLTPTCQTCDARASVEVFDASHRSHGYYCLRCGRRKLAVLQRLEAAFAIREGRRST